MTSLSGAGASPGTWLRRQREAAGLTQEELADRAGLTVRTIRNLECGRTSSPHTRSISMLARALGLPETVPGELTTWYRVRHPPGYPRPVPHSLPGGVPYFVARDAETAALTKLLDQLDGAGTVVAAMDGIAGAGKTTLALHWARQVSARFPDGQLHVNLRGFDQRAAPAQPGEAIRVLLDALGVPAHAIPPELAAQAALYRTLLSGKKVLVVLDNARDEQQVRPLLPAAPGCMVLVTSRNQLVGLSALDGAHLMTVGEFTPDDARAFLGARLGADRIAAEPDAVAEITALCGFLPLALSIAASRVAARPGLPLSAVAADLRGAGDRLSVLDTGDPAASVGAAFSWSLRQLSAPAARMFRLLSTVPGPDIGVQAAASLAGVSAAQARDQLGELARGHLVDEYAPGRYAMPDLLRVYASAQVQPGRSGPAD